MGRKKTGLEITPERPASGSPLRFSDLTEEIQAIFDDCSFKAPSNNSKFVTPAPYQVRDKLQRESSDVKSV